MKCVVVKHLHTLLSEGYTHTHCSEAVMRRYTHPVRFFHGSTHIHATHTSVVLLFTSLLPTSGYSAHVKLKASKIRLWLYMCFRTMHSIWLSAPKEMSQQPSKEAKQKKKKKFQLTLPLYSPALWQLCFNQVV